MNNFDDELHPPIPSPLQLLYDVMSVHASCIDPQDHENSNDLAACIGLDRDEVAQELLTIWLPVFKFKSALTFALESMRAINPAGIESHFCSFYLEVLKGIKN
jgi:hypothetical protein